LAVSKLDVDLVVNQNLGIPKDAYQDLAVPGCLSLIGPEFAMLRPEFAELRGENPRLRRGVHRVLIFMSGADEHNVTDAAVRAVGALDLPADVVVGAAYPHFDTLLSFVQGHRRLLVHRHTDHMAALMDRADLSIGAPSSASWERCCLGLPTILISLADNQVGAGAALARSGAAIDLGWFSHVASQDIRHAIGRVENEPTLLAAMSRAAAGITDGRGAARVASALEALLAEREGA
jgi:spore coat polysaccharide biosynthesis predicted glycosyltransferase SpsG